MARTGERKGVAAGRTGTRASAAARAIAPPAWWAIATDHWPALLAIGLTLALGLPTLNYPYGPDQALFAYIGDHIAHGSRLYVDVWDVKPPGIFWLYALITRLPGPPFRMLRLFDLAYTAATVAALYALGRAYWDRLAGGVAAALYGAVYVSATGYWHSAQPDSFLVLPLALALWCWQIRGHPLPGERSAGSWRSGQAGGTGAAQRNQGSDASTPQTGDARHASFEAAPANAATILGWSFAAGALFALCVQLRPVVIFVPAVLVLLELPGRKQHGVGRRERWRRGGRAALALAAGMAAVELMTLLWLALNGAAGAYFYAQLTFASEYGRQGGPYSPDGLTVGNYLSGLRTGTMFIIFARMLLTAPALFAVVAGGLLRRDRRVTQVAWLLLAAFAGVAVQGKFFLYHWHLVLPFLALLSGWAAAFTWQALRAAGRSAVAAGATLAAIGALLLALTPNVTDTAAREWSAYLRFYRTPSSRSAYYDRFGLYGRGSFSYRASEEVAGYLRARTTPGDTIFIWGYDPLLYLTAERGSPSRFLSFLPLMSTWTPHAWTDEFVDDLARRRPAYIILQRGENARWITGHSIDAVDFVPLIPRFQATLEQQYVKEQTIEDYTLYRRR